MSDICGNALYRVTHPKWYRQIELSEIGKTKTAIFFAVPTQNC